MNAGYKYLFITNKDIFINIISSDNIDLNLLGNRYKQVFIDKDIILSDEQKINIMRCFCNDSNEDFINTIE